MNFPIPNPGCSYNDFVPFGLEMHNGRLYVGVTCTGETSQNENDTFIHVYELNTNSGNYNLVFSSDVSTGYWSDDRISNRQTMQWLTDIDFTEEGHMILALSDRIGHTFCNDNVSRIDDQRGDILLVANVNGSWQLEQNGSIPGYSGSGVGNGQGPGGGEFFGDDYFPGNPSEHPDCLLYTSPSPRDATLSRMPSSA